MEFSGNICLLPCFFGVFSTNARAAASTAASRTIEPYIARSSQSVASSHAFCTRSKWRRASASFSAILASLATNSLYWFAPGSAGLAVPIWPYPAIHCDGGNRRFTTPSGLI